MKKVKKIISWIVATMVLIIAIANLWVVNSTSDQVISNEPIVGYDVAIVLGTSNKLTDGSENPFFEGRINAAAELYKQGAIKYIIVSGDNSSQYYNEPIKMREALIGVGVPAAVITLDYAGLRTLDSMIRCKEVFDQDKVVIVSQEFHCYRALFIANYLRIDAVAYSGNSIPVSKSFRVLLREYLARPIAIWDTYIIGKKPKYLGNKEELNRG